MQTLRGSKQTALNFNSPTVTRSKKQALSRTCRAVDPSSSSIDNSTADENSRIQVEISTNDAQTALRFSAVRVGGGKAIVVEAVAEGSEAEEAGIRPGQQLFSLSDPIRPQETWFLNDRASLRYIKDAVRMRRAPFIMLELSSGPLKEWVEEKQGSGLPSPLNSYTSESDADPEEEKDDLLSAVAAQAAATAASSLSSSDSMDLDGNTTSSGTSSGGTSTIGDRLQRNYNKSNSGMTDLEKRVNRRKEYFDQTSTRNDTPFFLGVLAAFLLPAVIILGIASSSGYLDALEAGWVGR